MACEVTMGSHRMYSNCKGISRGLKRILGAVALVALSNSVMAADKTPNTQTATPQQIAAVGTKFRVEDCALWRGGPGHENDNVPASYSLHVEAILEFLDNLSINEAMRAIELYCSSKGFVQ